jgi:hypothetical protein
MRKSFTIDDAKIDAIMAAYRQPKMAPSDILLAVASDVQFRLPMTRAAEIKSGTSGQAPVYMYNFGWTIHWSFVSRVVCNQPQGNLRLNIEPDWNSPSLPISLDSWQPPFAIFQSVKQRRV